ncbi:MAG: hypothetical protein VX737_01775 [Pseudomonadota bacterium]|nr:hypothetical protein [Pseudomonadota bacterium]
MRLFVKEKVFPLFFVLLIACMLVFVYGGLIVMSKESPKVHPSSLSTSNLKRKVLVVLFGIASRGLPSTWSQMHKKIIIPLEKSGYNVTVHIINNDIGDVLIDGKSLNPDAFNALGFKSVDHYKQSDIDKVIFSHCTRHINCSKNQQKLQQDRVYLNIFRQMFLEQKVADYLFEHGDHFDLALAAISDMYPLIELDSNDVLHASKLSSAIYMSGQSDQKGYTNGLYIGRPMLVAKSLSGLDHESLYDHFELIPFYERRLKMSMDEMGIGRFKSSFNFCKMRASHCCSWQGDEFVFSSQTDERLKAIFQSAKELQNDGYVLSPARNLKGFEKKYYLFKRSVLKFFGWEFSSCMANTISELERKKI